MELAFTLHWLTLLRGTASMRYPSNDASQLYDIVHMWNQSNYDEAFLSATESHKSLNYRSENRRRSTGKMWRPLNRPVLQCATAFLSHDVYKILLLRGEKSKKLRKYQYIVLNCGISVKKALYYHLVLDILLVTLFVTSITVRDPQCCDRHES